MYRKLFIIKVVLVLGIPLFPLGALFFLSKNRIPLPREELAERGTFPIAQPELQDQGLLQTGVDQLARIFRPPINKPAPIAGIPAEPAYEGADIDPAPIPGDEKFSYLGLIRETDDQEWLYLKDRESGRIISINASLISAGTEYSVVDIGGIQYFIRRN
ncbi:MAG: hypothetical protein LBP74_07505 [Treponema sp.]|jgi:hypothetical protein|nr:hypothetical protein [Treponema sp.]